MSAQATATPFEAMPYKVLVVEDDAAQRHLMRATLAFARPCTAARLPAEAARILEEEAAPGWRNGDGVTA